MPKSKTHILLKITVSIVMMMLMLASTRMLANNNVSATHLANAVSVSLIVLQTWYRYKWNKTKNKIDNFMANMFLVEGISLIYVTFGNANSILAEAYWLLLAAGIIELAMFVPGKELVQQLKEELSALIQKEKKLWIVIAFITITAFSMIDKQTIEIVTGIENWAFYFSPMLIGFSCVLIAGIAVLKEEIHSSKK